MNIHSSTWEYLYKLLGRAMDLRAEMKSELNEGAAWYKAKREEKKAKKAGTVSEATYEQLSDEEHG